MWYFSGWVNFLILRFPFPPYCFCCVLCFRFALLPFSFAFHHSLSLRLRAGWWVSYYRLVPFAPRGPTLSPWPGGCVRSRQPHGPETRSRDKPTFPPLPPLPTACPLPLTVPSFYSLFPSPTHLTISSLLTHSISKSSFPLARFSTPQIPSFLSLPHFFIFWSIRQRSPNRDRARKMVGK